MRSALFWDFTQRRLVVSCLMRRDNGCEILTAVLVKIFVVWDVSPCRLSSFPLSSGPTVQYEGITFHRNVRNPSSTGRNLLQHLCENVMSHRIEDCAGPSYCLWCVFYGSMKIIAAFTKSHTGLIFFIPWIDRLKLWLTPTSAQFYSLCKISVTCRR
jgi:hypothetical protein